MTRIYVWKRTYIWWVALILLLGVLTWTWGTNQGVPVFSNDKDPDQKEFWIVAGEFKSELEKGKEIEAYRWDPANIIVHKGDRVTLKFRGINGASHPFVIKGLNVNGEVKKGEVTSVTFVAEKPGTYPLICLAHPTVEQNGPMIGYVHVLED
ncbi:MAG: cupredoxin domain-containing protein [Bacillaceae bacterium]|nr:cupredoxin domain-containing protein [Bacillaceae bacterium]